MKGKSLAVAPEGTRSGSGRLGPFKKGAFRLAMAGGVPIVPIVFRNANDVWPLGTQFMRPGTVDVVVHPPIPTDDWTDEDLDARIAEVRAPLPGHAGELAGPVTAREVRAEILARAEVRERDRRGRQPPPIAPSRRHRRARRRPARDGGHARRSRGRRVPPHRPALRPRPRTAGASATTTRRWRDSRTSIAATPWRCCRATAPTSTRWCWRRCCSAPPSLPPTSSAASTSRSGRWGRWDAAPG